MKKIFVSRKNLKQNTGIKRSDDVLPCVEIEHDGVKKLAHSVKITGESCVVHDHFSDIDSESPRVWIETKSRLILCNQNGHMIDAID